MDMGRQIVNLFYSKTNSLISQALSLIRVKSFSFSCPEHSASLSFGGRGTQQAQMPAGQEKLDDKTHLSSMYLVTVQKDGTQ